MRHEWLPQDNSNKHSNELEKRRNKQSISLAVLCTQGSSELAASKSNKHWHDSSVWRLHDAHLSRSRGSHEVRNPGAVSCCTCRKLKWKWLRANLSNHVRKLPYNGLFTDTETFPAFNNYYPAWRKKGNNLRLSALFLNVWMIVGMQVKACVMSAIFNFLDPSYV